MQLNRKLEVYDRELVCLMKLLGNCQDVPGTKQDTECKLFGCLLIWLTWQAGNCVSLHLLTLKPYLMSLPRELLSAPFIKGFP